MEILHRAAVLKGIDRFARAWAKDIAGTSYVAMSRDEVEDRLRALTRRFVDALLEEPFVAAPAAAIGAALIESRFTASETLGRTIQVFGSRLLDDLGLATAAGYSARLLTLQSTLATGYAQALRDWVLAEQESIHEAALRASDARFRAVFAGSAIGIAIGDPDGVLLDVNKALLDMLGVRAAELKGCRLDDLAHAEDAASVRAAYGDLRRGSHDHIRMEKRFSGKDGAALWANLTISCLRDDDGRCRVQLTMLEDVTDRHVLQTQLRYQAGHDPLTGLPNRTLLSERLAGAMAGAPDGRVGVCFIDLDGFKAVNDSLGHDVGDRLLVGVSDRLRRCLSPPEHLLARMGGDEFVILVPNSRGTDEVVALADRILAELADPIQVDRHALSIGASIGIVERPVRGTDPADLLRAADITLYRAKSDGKGRWALFDPERNAHEITRHTLATMLPGALERNQFILDYQPIVSLRDGALSGVEALVRWRHPSFGLLGPDLFIGLAEETGLIVPLGLWVLETACRQGRDWQNPGGTEPFVSVNLTVRQTQDPDLVDHVRRVLGDTGLPPDRLQLELTESAFMGTATEPLGVLRTLAGMGVRIAIDDFGTGYSNLAYLRRLPVHSLKLAGHFVEGLRSRETADLTDERIVQTLVALAHTLNLSVTAEGVETAAQAERLRAVECDTAQGYLFAPPLPPEEIVCWLAGMAVVPAQSRPGLATMTAGPPPAR